MIRSIAVVALAGLAAACGAKPAPEPEPSAPPVAVRVERVAMAPFEERYEGVGTIASRTTSVLSSKVMGQITSVRVKEGDRVSAGQVLVEIDARDAAAQNAKATAGMAEAEQALAGADGGIRAAESALAAAEANRKLAEVTYQRYRQLLEERSVSRQEFDEAEARYKTAEAEASRAREMLGVERARRDQVVARIAQAKADVSAAKVVLSYPTITAPISGVVVKKHVDPGTMAVPGMPLVTIEDGQSYRLEASVAESLAPRVRAGSTVVVRVDALGGQTFDGTVAEVSPASDPASRTLLVKIDLPAHPALRSGLYATAAFPVDVKQAISVPRAAVVERGQLAGVFVVDEQGRARLRFVTTGKTSGDRTEILSGLGEGDRVVVEGMEQLSDGRMVTGA